ncbi:hypothetical protein HQQ94_04480 [Shewanella sp. VB17]|uniref:hypothetical protein n=1 Tax=Shewanella sp. VB17 TaxID=2739432 RepID=UPI0015634E43|nr:hypothetical protein [Shewanella sp. VB17]NRD72514.1 hypothetical protein [Shewanella sp. VB17]
MQNKEKYTQKANNFNRGALRMTVTMLRDRNPALALLVQNQMFDPINPQADNNPNPRDNFKVELPPLDIRHIVETLTAKQLESNIDPGTNMLIKSLIIDWMNYANMLIELANNENTP